MAEQNITQDTCEKCKFWLRQDEQNNKFNEPYGECRRNPPVLFRYSDSNKTDDSILDIIAEYTHFPVTFFDCYCGEFKHFLELLK